MTGEQLPLPASSGNLTKSVNTLLFKLFNSLTVNATRFIAVTLAVRYMTKEDFGLYTSITNLVLLFVAFGNLGIPTSTTQHMSHFLYKNQDMRSAKGVFVTSAWFRICGTLLIGFLFLFFVPNYYQDDKVVSLLTIAVAMLVLRSFDIWLEYGYAALQQYKQLFVFVTLPREGLRIALVFALIYWGFNSWRFIGVEVIVFLISVLLACVALTRQFYYVDTKKTDWRPFVRFALTIAPTSLLVLSYERFNIFILSEAVPLSELAEYNAAYQLTALAATLIPVGSIAILPTFMSLGKERLNQLINMLMRLTVSIMLPIVLFLIFFGEVALSTLYGEKYIAAAPILSVFSCLLVERIISPTIQQVLIALGKPKIITLITVIGGGMNILLAIFLIDRLGVIGSAIALVVSRFTVLILQLGVLISEQFQIALTQIMVIILSSSIMLIPFIGNIDSWVAQLMMFLIGLLIYGLILARHVIPQDVVRARIVANQTMQRWGIKFFS